MRERQKLEEEAQKYRYATSQRGQEQYLELMERIRQMDIEDQKRNLAKERDEKLDALDRQKNDIETWYNDIRETIEAFSGDFISIYKLTEDERFNAFVTTNEKIKAELERFKAEYAAIYGISPAAGQSNQNASIIAQMQANSAAWKSASAAERARLEAENQRLGASLGATLDRKTGRWMLGGLPLYHTGGRVGEFNFRTGDRLMPDEIAAILRRDEYVFTPQQLESLIGAKTGGPSVNVHIEKVMEVNDATFEDGIDLRALGRDAGDTAAAVIRTQFTGGGGR
ncbi:hypothetical protein PACILC2_22890 [Paenibacillus cisolokensis]|uniref:Uncharacterized protein n=1 Tax=Paenibacillus cisolokensis TaxID=1658519 RepID=A0ABQ4N737_9BACL|nr:hypothetical protein [Paenibacillus cisolokensis]GIQ63721.1 hypothetical protein PACILC2_22890 [Paenibacillus cisolokensis]